MDKESEREREREREKGFKSASCDGQELFE